MAKFTHSQNNFIAGELSPRLEGRIDIQEYANGAALIENFIPVREGGLTRRPGSVFVRNITADAAAKGGLYPFIVSRTESYIVAVSSISGGDFCIYRQTYAGGPQLTLVYDGTAVPTEISNYIQPGLDVKKFNYVQINNILLLTHISGTIPPIIIKRTGVNTFTVNLYSVEVNSDSGLPLRGLVFLPPGNNAAKTITTASLGGGNFSVIANHNLFSAGLVGGGYIRIKNPAGGAETVYKINTYNSAVNVTCTVLTGPAVAIANAPEFAINSWNDAFGWPRSVALFQQRLVFGGTTTEPTNLWFGFAENLYLLLNYKLAQDSSTDVSGNKYFGAISDSDAFDITLTSNLSNIILWMSSDQNLQIGTTSAEYTVSTVDGKFGPRNANAVAQTFYGSNDSSAVRAQNSVIFVTADGKSVRELYYSFENGGNISRLLSVLADQMVYHGINSLATSIYDTEYSLLIYQASRSCIWGVTNAGRLVGFVLERSSNSLAWHRHSIGGTNVQILGACIIPDDLGKYDTLYLNVQRTINGNTVNYIESIGSDFDLDILYGQENTDLRNFPTYSDSFFYPTDFATYGAGRPLVPHLQGETVEVIVKGIYKGLAVVKDDLPGGQPYIEIEDLNAVSYDVLVGLSYKSKVRSMPVEAGSRTGPAIPYLKRVEAVVIKIFRGLRLKFGPSESLLETMDLSDSINPVKLYTGLKRANFKGSPSEDQRYYIESDGPLPLTILSVALEGNTRDG